MPAAPDLHAAPGLDWARRRRPAPATLWGANMSKGLNQKKETKKQPAKTAKEKKAAKQEKKKKG